MSVQILPLPRLRADLRVSPHEANGSKTFVVKHPATGRFFRLKEMELFIARQLDGRHTSEAIQELVRLRYGARIGLETLERFILKLRQVDLLIPPQGSPSPEPRPGRKHRFRGSLLYLRLASLDPDRLLGRLAGIFRPCFSRWFVALSVAVMLAGAAVFISNGADIVRGLSFLLRWDLLVATWTTLILITVLHELAHGVTCKHFGGDVREMGIVLIYFQPGLYCNVSDAWLFSERGKRLWVTLAGAYLEVLIGAAAMLVWRVVEPGTWISSISLAVVISSAVKTFFNLNPLIKLDGYYLLSDLLGIPNLREKAFRYLGGALRFRRRPPDAAGDRPGARDRCIFVAYGLLSFAYSSSFLALVALQVGGALIRSYQGVGFIGFSALLLAILRRPLGRGLRMMARFLRPRRGLLPSMRWCGKLLVASALVAGAGAALVLIPVDLRVAGGFKVLPTHHADVRAEVEGIIAEVLVDEGDRVEPGTVIARLSDRDYRAEVAEIEAEIASRRSSLDLLRAGARPEEIDLGRRKVETARTRSAQALRWLEEARKLKTERTAKARTTVKKTEARLKYSRANFARLERLLRQDIISSKEFEEAEETISVQGRELEEAQAELKLVLADDLAAAAREVAVAAGEVREAEAAFDLLTAGRRSEEIDAMRAEVSRLQARRDYLGSLLERIVLVSPATGVLTTPRPREKVGQQVKKGDLVVEVQERGDVRVEIAVSEKDAGDVEIGQPVALKARAWPATVFSARVAAIAPAAAAEDQPGGGPVVRVSCRLEDPLSILKPEMTGMAKISCGDRPLGEVITRRIRRYVRVEFWSWW